MKKRELRSAEDMKTMADSGKRSFVDMEYEHIVEIIEREALDGKYEVEFNGTLSSENKEKLLKAGYTIEVTRYSLTADFTTTISWKNPEQDETSIQDSEDESDGETWCLTPKGILYCALQEAGFVKSAPDERVDKAYEVFETLMRAGGYIEEEE